MLKVQQGDHDQKVIRVILDQKETKNDRGLKGHTGAQGLREIRVTKEILVYKAQRVILVHKGSPGSGAAWHQGPKGDKGDIGSQGQKGDTAP